MARFGQSSKADMLSVLAEAEEDSSDGLETPQQTKPRTPRKRIPQEPEREQAPTPVPEKKQVEWKKPIGTPAQSSWDELTLDNAVKEEQVVKEVQQVEETFDPTPVEEEELNMDSLDSLYGATEKADEWDFVEKAAESIPYSIDSTEETGPSNLDQGIILDEEPYREYAPVEKTPSISQPPVNRETPYNPPIEMSLGGYEEYTPNNAPQSNYQAPRNETTSAYVPPTGVSIPSLHSSSKSEVAFAQTVIKVYEELKKLSPEELMIAAQFIAKDGSAASDYASLAVATINIEKNLPPTMKALVESKELGEVERAFHVMSLEGWLLSGIGALAEVLSGRKISVPPSSQIAYSRELVALIESLTNESMSYIKATDRVISASLP